MKNNANKDVIKLPDKSEQQLIALFAEIIVSTVIRKANEKKTIKQLTAVEHKHAQ